MSRNQRIILTTVCSILLLLGLIYAGRAYARRAKIASLQEQAEAMMSQPRDGEQDNRREQFQSLREEVRTLPEADQQVFRASMEQMRRQREESQLDAFLALSPAERKKHLDKEIKEEEARRKRWESRRAQGDMGGRGGPPGEGRGGPPGGGPPGGGPPGGANRGDRGNWRGGGSLTARLDSTSPEFRAKRTEYRREKEQRRKELGLPPSRR